MSTTGVSSVPTQAITTSGPTDPSVTNGPPSDTPSTSPTITTEETPTTAPPPPPPPETTTSPPETTAAPPPETTSSEIPPTTTSVDSTTSTEQPPPEPTTSTPSVTVITITPSSTDPTTITLTTTSSNINLSTSSPSVSSSSSSSSTSSTTSATAIPSTGGGGLSTPAKIAIAIIIPIFAVALIVFLGIFFWRRYRKRKDSEEMRRKEVEEYGYNPNNDFSGPTTSVIGAGAMGHGGQDMAESDAGYRGWGSTAGGRKASAPLSTGASNTTGYGNTGFTDGGMSAGQQNIPPAQPELYGSSAADAITPAIVGGAAALAVSRSHSDPKQNRDRHSNSPLLSSPTQRPSTADSSTIGTAAMNPPIELDDGLHRGDSVASSHYTNATRESEASDVDTPIGPTNQNRNNYYGNDGADYYNDVANPYAPGDYDYNEAGQEGGYHQPPPVIQEVGARRNTRIEEVSDNHYPQMPRHGNSGIAQNF